MTVAKAPGTGPIQLGHAVRSNAQTFRTFHQAGMQDGDRFSYKIQDRWVGWEEGEGRYLRGVVYRENIYRNSMKSAERLNFSADARVAVVILESDITDKLSRITDRADDKTILEGEDNERWISSRGAARLVRDLEFALYERPELGKRSSKDRWKDWVRINEQGTDTAALNEMLKIGRDEGKKVIVAKPQSGVYELTSTLGLGLIGQSLHIIFEGCPQIKVQHGFPDGRKAIQFLLKADSRFRIDGDVKIDVSSLPRSSGKEANDAFSLHGDGTGRCYLGGGIEIFHGSGASHENGGDSSFFFGYLKEVYANFLRGEGAPDSIFYVSGGSDNEQQPTSEIFLDGLIGRGGMVGLIAKRAFRNIQVGRCMFDNCGTAVCFGGEASIGGAQFVDGRNVQIDQVMASRCDTTLNIRLSTNVSVGSVVASEIGREGGAAAIQAVLLQGAQCCTIRSIQAVSQNPLALSRDACAVVLDDRKVNDSRRSSTDNFLGPISSRGLRRSILEKSADQDRNKYVIGSEIDMADSNVVLGPNSRILF